MQEVYKNIFRPGLEPKEKALLLKSTGHNKPIVSHMKQEEAPKYYLSYLVGTMNVPQLVTNHPIIKGLERAGFTRIVLGTQPLLKLIKVSQSPQIQRPTLPSQKPSVLSSQTVIQTTSMERNQPLNPRPRVHSNSRSNVKSTEMTLQNKNYIILNKGNI